jgi:hypothetical protein
MDKKADRAPWRSAFLLSKNKDFPIFFIPKLKKVIEFIGIM